jgi:hypothetical protein
MIRLLRKVIVCFGRLARPGPHRPRPVRLRLEAMEAREVLSATLLPFPGAAPAPGLVRAPHGASTGWALGEAATTETGHTSGKRQHEPLTSSPGGVVSPDQPVYGYKHRRWRPWPWLAEGAQGPSAEVLGAALPRLEGLAGEHQREALTPQTLAHEGEVFLHLAAGGADGKTVLAGGVLVVHHPEGPLPTEGLAAAR